MIPDTLSFVQEDLQLVGAVYKLTAINQLYLLSAVVTSKKLTVYLMYLKVIKTSGACISCQLLKKPNARKELVSL